MALSLPWLLLVLTVWSSVCNGSDTISAGESLFLNQTLISKQGRFEFGLFAPANSTNYYVGIWYKTIPIQTVVWVLNRNHSIQSSFRDTCLLQMSNGSLTLVANSKVIWRSMTSLFVTEALILDTGNFVLKNASGILWQSFHNPTDTWLPGAMVGIESKLTSWRNGDDPAIGDYSLGMEPNGGGELFIKKNGREMRWRSGIWQGVTLPAFSSASNTYNFSFVDGAFLTYKAKNESWVVRIVLSDYGAIHHLLWHERSQRWLIFASQPTDDACSRFAICGPNAVCDIRFSPICQCLDGFVPLVRGEWDDLDFSGGCRRIQPLQCDVDKMEFLKLSNIMFPAYAETLEIARKGICQLVCRVNCSCTAYANSDGGGCLLFTGDLIDSQRMPNDSGITLYVKMGHDDPPMKGKGNKIIVALVVPITCGILIISSLCILWWKKLRNIAHRSAHKNVSPRDLKTYFPTCISATGEDQSNEHELPIFSFASIALSTNNFSGSNKLGEGGFGPVYKAELANEHFVAVKKLSQTSGQGLQEFKNEVQLIAKLQHRNLVGILGCCVENEEKILVYEYMPNKSLDFFLFDPRKKARLSWEIRVRIIQGIAQGLLYLHHYSRLRIVHRATDTIRANESLTGSKSLISSGSRFKLSFFSPPNRSLWYVGIMFDIP
ncbi:G-type lectin S-receptor-like serine/threonine-protein kinase At1g11330 [Salvia hispanica]|uniref:G-type lectin S-receptor-like serine/threonine-protein kinase At1g11330 n=1 Tax=Salvia hispanica TaxID=49212 RepID=UPI002009B742|nr:G-type lectin S-receptor-like serine/threonine-protein kinase At1g11330 [Salvia hispanica]